MFHASGAERIGPPGLVPSRAGSSSWAGDLARAALPTPAAPRPGGGFASRGSRKPAHARARLRRGRRRGERAPSPGSTPGSVGPTVNVLPLLAADAPPHLRREDVGGPPRGRPSAPRRRARSACGRGAHIGPRAGRRGRGAEPARGGARRVRPPVAVAGRGARGSACVAAGPSPRAWPRAPGADAPLRPRARPPALRRAARTAAARSPPRWRGVAARRSTEREDLSSPLAELDGATLSTRARGPFTAGRVIEQALDVAARASAPVAARRAQGRRAHAFVRIDRRALRSRRLAQSSSNSIVRGLAGRNTWTMDCVPSRADSSELGTRVLRERVPVERDRRFGGFP